MICAGPVANRTQRLRLAGVVAHEDPGDIDGRRPGCPILADVEVARHAHLAAKESAQPLGGLSATRASPWAAWANTAVPASVPPRTPMPRTEEPRTPEDPPVPNTPANVPEPTTPVLCSPSLAPYTPTALMPWGWALMLLMAGPWPNWRTAKAARLLRPGAQGGCRAKPLRSLDPSGSGRPPRLRLGQAAPWPTPPRRPGRRWHPPAGHGVSAVRFGLIQRSWVPSGSPAAECRVVMRSLVGRLRPVQDAVSQPWGLWIYDSVPNGQFGRVRRRHSRRDGHLVPAARRSLNSSRTADEWPSNRQLPQLGRLTRGVYFGQPGRELTMSLACPMSLQPT